MYFAERWMAGGTENIKRSEWLSQHAAHCDGLKRESRMEQIRQVEAPGFDVKLTETFSESNHVSVPGKKEEKRKRKKPNYALFPPIKPLISTDWFRNMKQNSE